MLLPCIPKWIIVDGIGTMCALLMDQYDDVGLRTVQYVFDCFAQVECCNIREFGTRCWTEYGMRVRSSVTINYVCNQPVESTVFQRGCKH